jgi:sugar phosphate isomerase/epimerase
MPNFGYHAVYEENFRSAIKAAADYDFQYVQFDLNVPRFYIDRLNRRQLRDIESLSADSGIRISFHSPGDNISLFTDYPLVRKGLLDHLKLILEKANQLNAHHLTVHPLYPPSFRRADTLEDSFLSEHQSYFKDILKENLTQLIKTAGKVLIFVENFNLGNIANMAISEMISKRTDIFLALDWAKMHTDGLAANEDQQSFYIEHKSLIRELHLHDMDIKGKSHLSPGQGSLDFKPLFRQFFDQSQCLTIEVRPVLEAAKAKGIFTQMIEEIGGK